MKKEFRQHFCKIYSLPIKIYDSPIFESRLELLKDLYGINHLIELFEKETACFKDFGLYLKEYENAKDLTIKHIQEKTSYQSFISTDFSKYKTPNIQIKKQNLYQPDNNDTYFLGFDLCQANFNSLKYFDKDIIDSKDTWEEFFSQFTTYEHLIKSKYIRQVICGACNPSRQVTIEKYLMFFVYEEIKKYFKDEDIVHFSEDEIVIQTKSHPQLEKNIIEISKQIGFKIRIEKYKLIKVSGADVYFKVFEDGQIKLKCGNSLIIPFILRGIDDKPYKDEDFYFVHEGMKAKLMEAPQIYVPLLKY